MSDKEHRRLTIAELEELLDKENSWDDDRAIQILPNGEITYADEKVKGVPKVLTMKENLGGEYGRNLKTAIVIAVCLLTIAVAGKIGHIPW